MAELDCLGSRKAIISLGTVAAARHCFFTAAEEEIGKVTRVAVRSGEEPKKKVAGVTRGYCWRREIGVGGPRWRK